MEETVVLFQIGAVSITAYSAIMAIGMLSGMLLSYGCARRTGAVRGLPQAMLSASLGAVLGGHLLYCLAMLPSILADFQSGLSLFYRLNMGGYTLYGGLLGGMLAVWLYARHTGQKTAPLLDALVPGALLTLFFGRAAEYFTTQGRGDYLDEFENVVLCRFPIAVPAVYEDYVEWRYAVFAWEAAAAAVILMCVLLTLRRTKAEGTRTEMALTLVSASQILFEQLRQDGFLRFGFVRLTQIAAIAVIAGVLALRIGRNVRKKGWSPWQFGRMALVAIGAAVVILVEFAYDKPQVLPALRLCISALSVLGTLALAIEACGRRRTDPVAAVSHAVLGGVTLACGAVLIVLLTQNLTWESNLLTAAMAFALAVIAAATLHGDSPCD